MTTDELMAYLDDLNAFPLMKCGHKANGYDLNDPVCTRPECFGFENTGYDEIMED